MFNDDYDDDYGFEQKKRPAEVSLTPPKFYSVVEVMKSVDKDLQDNLDSFVETAGPVLDAIDNDVQSIAQANNDMLQELRISTRKSPFSTNQEQDFSNYKHSLSNHNFIRVAYDSVKSIQTGYHTLLSIASDLRPKELVLSNEKLVVGDGKVETIQKMMFEMQLNTSSVRSFISAIEKLDHLELSISQIASNNYKILESYYHKLQHRHSVEGVEIFRDAIATDVAISIYENVDHHGEIEGGRKADEVSAYTMRKAELIAKALKNGLLASFITSPPAFFDFIKDNLRALWKNTENLKKLFQSQIDKIKSVLGTKSSHYSKSSKYLFEDTLTILGDLDPRNVVYKEKTVILSSEERYNLKFRNETVAEIVRLLNDNGASVKDIVDYILERKAQLRSFFQDENSFFVCKIGSGNPFQGEAPGGLEVIPSQRPQGKLDDIVGSGFDEVKEFIKTIEHAAKWHDLFQATSPSKTADKSNILLVGPMGCLSGETYIQYEVWSLDGQRVNHKGGSISRLFERFNGLPQSTNGPKWRRDVEFFAPSMTDDGSIIQNKINGVINSGQKECFRIVTEHDNVIEATADHEFFVGDKYTQLSELKVGDIIYCHNNVRKNVDRLCNRNNERKYVYVKHHPIAGTKNVNGKYEYKRLATARAVWEANLNNLSFQQYISLLNSGEIVGLQFLPRTTHVHHKDENFLNDSLENLEAVDGLIHNREHGLEDHDQLNFVAIEDKILSIESVGIKTTYDVQMSAPFHNIVADGIVVHNCGKTEIMRSVANDKKSIGIFAQGSDFMTCWKGESQKNPKRLFEAGMKIQRDSGKHVHFLIDEIDSVLNDDKEYGSDNLSLEFQILMDGVVHYPNLSIWGATNNPERIPMPMIRRFSKVLIVGELDLKDRVHLLKHFVGFLPTDEFNDTAWEDMAKKLDGATGDVVRKVADHLWRTKMSWFVSSHEKEAAKLVSELNHGEKFQIGEFNDKARYEFKAKLGTHFSVKPVDLEKSIKTHLNNIAIRNEIATAKDTYRRAKEFLNAINSDAI